MKKTSKSSFRGKVSQAVKTDKAKASSYGYLKLPNGVSVFSPEVTADKSKSYLLDFLPYLVTSNTHPEKDEKEGIAVKGSYWWRFPFKVHRNVGAGTGDTVVCLGTFGKKCPICEEKIKRAKAGADKEELKSMSASDRYLYVVNPLDSPKHDAGKWHIFDISKALFQKLLNDEIEEESVSEVFMDLEEGETLKVRFTGKKIGNSKPFPEATKITPEERAKPYKISVADETPKLDDVLTVLTYEQLERKFFEIEEEVEEEIDDDEKPVRSKTKTVEKDEEEEEPVRKSKGKKQPDPEPEEEEEEEDNDEDADEPKITWDELLALNEKKLEKYCSANELEIDPDDFEDNEDGLRKAIAEELGVEIPKKKGKVESEPKKEKKERCPACKGTGKDAKGKMCKVCMGTGVKQAEVEEDDEEEDEKPVKKTSTKKSSSDECPHDHTFGKDVDKYDECDSCDLWDECMAAKKAKK